MKPPIAKPHTSLNLNDLELVLALIRGRTLKGAAERLKVDASTVFRAIKRLERDLGEVLFDRGRQGYTPTGLARELGGHAERIESALQEARDTASKSSGGPSGVLRITTTESVLHGVLLPLLARFADTYPGIELELVATNALANLSHREADVAIRPTRRPPEHLVGTRLGTIKAAVYASKEYLQGGRQYPDGVDWIALDDTLAGHPSHAWLRERYPQVRPRHRANSLLSVAGAVARGIGVGVVPLALLGDNPDVAVVEGPLEALDMDLWCLAHPDARNLQRVKLLFAFLREHVVLPA